MRPFARVRKRPLASEVRVAGVVGLWMSQSVCCGGVEVAATAVIASSSDRESSSIGLMHPIASYRL
jgi:hypothetical protein